MLTLLYGLLATEAATRWWHWLDWHGPYLPWLWLVFGVPVAVQITLASLFWWMRWLTGGKYPESYFKWIDKRV